MPPGQPNTPLNTDWDLAPSSRMTNGTVGTVAVADGRTLTVNYGSGEVKIVVPDDAPVVTSGAGGPDHAGGGRTCGRVRAQGR